VVGNEPRLEPGERVEVVLDEAFKRVVGAFLVHEAGVFSLTIGRASIRFSRLTLAAFLSALLRLRQRAFDALPGFVLSLLTFDDFLLLDGGAGCSSCSGFSATAVQQQHDQTEHDMSHCKCSF
jgi:hypothetical protein